MILYFFISVLEESRTNSFSSKSTVSKLCLTPKCIKAGNHILIGIFRVTFVHKSMNENLLNKSEKLQLISKSSYG